MEDWSKLFWIALDLVVTALVIILIVVCGQIGRGIAQNQQNDNDAIALAQEYRTYNRYDQTTIYAQDVVAALLEFRGKPKCVVQTRDGSSHTYYPTYALQGQPTSNANDYATDTLQALYIGANNNQAAYDTYNCTLIKDTDGDISEIDFKVVP